MTLRCHACDKPLLRYAVAIPTSDGGEYGFGPKCGQRFIVRKKREVKAAVPWRRASVRVPVRDPAQQDWINEAAMAA